MSMDSFDLQYRKLGEIGKGSFGVVYKCCHIQSNEIFAAKWIPFHNKRNGLPSLVLREISVLKELHHGNVVRKQDAYSVKYKDELEKWLCFDREILKNQTGILDLTGMLHDVIDTRAGCYLVLEYLNSDLGKFIKDRSVPLGPMDSRLIKNVLHRDLKPHNLLLDLDTKTVKLADFGYARTSDVPLSQYSTDVITPAYKAPEVLLRTPYTTAADIWSVGCIFAEMVTRHVLIDSCTESDCMHTIISKFGVPSERDWPGVRAACLRVCQVKKLPSGPIPDLAAIVPGLKSEGLDLLSKMLCVVPSRRITAYDALNHRYLEGAEVNRGSVLF